MNAPRDLLFGLLALQARLIVSDQLLEACILCTKQEDVSLPDMLMKLGWLQPSNRAKVDDLVERELRCSGRDASSGKPVRFDGCRTGVVGSQPTLNESEILCSTADVTQPGIATLSAGTDFRPQAHERYTRIRLHATGGIGCIWLARDNYLGREIALKELRPDQAGNLLLRSRFLKEAQITGQLEHPGIVPVYELTLQTEGQAPFYTMRFIKGQTLTEAARAFHAKRKEGRFDTLEWSILLNTLVTVCNTVAYAHSRGVLHRDLKGQNVILGDFGEVAVLDWGLAKLVGQAEGELPEPSVLLDSADSTGVALTVHGQVIGTPGYMAPEQAAGSLGEIDRRTDVYGLGAILYEILTGRPPFSGSDMRELLRRVREEEPTPPSLIWNEVPSTLEEVCLRALRKIPDDRFASPSELAQQVQQWQEVQRQQAEDALRASESLYHTLVETIPQMIVCKDLEGRFTFANQKLCAELGRTLEEIKGKTDLDFFPKELALKYRRDDQKVIESGQLVDLVEEHVTPQGDKRYVQVMKTPLYGPDGKAIGIQGTFWNVSDHRRLEEALARTTAELDQVKQQLQAATERGSRE